MSSASASQRGNDDIPNRSDEKTRRTWLVLSALLLISYALFLRATWYPVIVGADDHGYYAQGALLVNDGRMWFNLESPVQYVGRHWLRDESARYVSRYSPGMGMLLAGVTWLANAEASVAINPLLAIIALLGLWTLVATRIGPGWGLAAIAVLMFSPAFTGQAMLGGSHIVVTCLLVWGTHLLLRWRERGGAWRVLAGAMLMGFIPVVRPSEAVLALGVGIFLLLTANDHTRPWSHVGLAIGGALLAASPLLVYNHEVFGHVARTAYAITKEQTAFSPSYVPENVAFYSRFMLRFGLGVFTVLSAAGLAYVVFADDASGTTTRREARIRGAFLALLTVPVVVLYLTFFFVPQRQHALATRFLLPLFPLLIFASLLLVRRSTRGLTSVVRWSCLAILFVVHAAWGMNGIQRMTRQYVSQKERASSLVAAVEELVPDGSVVFSPEEALLVNLDIRQRWHVADRLLSLDDPLNAILDGENSTPGRMAKQRGKRKLQMQRFEGLSAHARDSLFAEEAQRWGAGGAVYYVGPKATLEHPTSALVSLARFDIVAERPLPLSVEMAKSAAGARPQERFVVARWKVGAGE